MFADDDFPNDSETDAPFDAPSEEEDFAQMLEESLEPQVFSEGQMVEGRSVSVGRDVAFVDVGGKGEATIDIEELADPDGNVDVEVGDIVQGVVVSTRGGLKLSHKLARGAATRQQLQDAYRAGLPVEGRVEKSIKGGFEVRIGGQRAFCPISQIDTVFTTDPTVHESQLYTFRIIEYKGEGKDLVVSRRALLEEEERERAEEIRSAAVPGAALPGRVVSVRPYGAFVDLGGGVQGLLHVSEMGWSRVSDPAAVVQPGDEITVKVLRIDEEKGKISLGLKQLQADPWSAAEDTYEVGQVLKGQVTRVTEFGAFIELEPGIEALAHVSTFPPRGKRDAWREAVPAGASVAVEILSFDVERKRIGVAVVEEGAVSSIPRPARATIEAGVRLIGKVERHEQYGVFVFLAPGRTGLVPLSETGVEREGDLRNAFPVGSDLEVMVLEVDDAGRRIRLSCKAVHEADQKSEARDYAKMQDDKQSEGFGSLADKLRAAMKPPED
jgi:small subunit ribosomal protein S1